MTVTVSKEAGEPDWPAQGDMAEGVCVWGGSLCFQQDKELKGAGHPNNHNQMPSHMVSRKKKAEGLQHRTHRLFRETGTQQRSIQNIHGRLSSHHCRLLGLWNN